MKKISESDLVDFTSAAFIDDTLETVVDASNVNQLNAIRDVLFLWEDIAPWARLDENGTEKMSSPKRLVADVVQSYEEIWQSFLRERASRSLRRLKQRRKKQLTDDSKFAILSESRAIELMKMKSSGDDDPQKRLARFTTPYESARGKYR